MEAEKGLHLNPPPPISSVDPSWNKRKERMRRTRWRGRRTAPRFHPPLIPPHPPLRELTMILIQILNKIAFESLILQAIRIFIVNSLL